MLDNAPPDADPDVGEFPKVDPFLGRYTVKEIAPFPPGFEPDPDAVAVDLTPQPGLNDVTITEAFVNRALFKLIVITCAVNHEGLTAVQSHDPRREMDAGSDLAHEPSGPPCGGGGPSWLGGGPTEWSGGGPPWFDGGGPPSFDGGGPSVARWRAARVDRRWTTLVGWRWTTLVGWRRTTLDLLAADHPGSMVAPIPMRPAVARRWPAGVARRWPARAGWRWPAMVARRWPAALRWL